MPRAPDRFSSGRASPSPRTGGGHAEHPKTEAAPAERLERFLAGGWLIRSRGGPGQLWPLPPWVPITWGCFSSRADQRSLLPWPPSRPEPGESRGCTHVPSPPGPAWVSLPRTPAGRVWGGCFLADSSVHVPSSGVRAPGTGSKRVASGLPVTPTDLEHAGRAGPQTWRLGTLQPPWAPVGLGLWELNGGAEASLGWRREGGRGTGAGREWEAGVSQRLGTRVGEKQSQQFPREEVASPPPPPGLQAGSWPTGPAGPLPADVPAQLRSSEGSLARPCLPAFLPLTTLAPLPLLP